MEQNLPFVQRFKKDNMFIFKIVIILLFLEHDLRKLDHLCFAQMYI